MLFTEEDDRKISIVHSQKINPSNHGVLNSSVQYSMLRIHFGIFESILAVLLQKTMSAIIIITSVADRYIQSQLSLKNGNFYFRIESVGLYVFFFSQFCLFEQEFGNFKDEQSGKNRFSGKIFTKDRLCTVHIKVVSC